MKNKDSLRLIKMLTALISFIALLMWFSIDEAEAGDYRHHDDTVINNYYSETLTETSYTNDTDIAKGVALSLATNHPFDFDTKKLQGSINGGYYDGQNALSLGLAKRFDKTDALLHTSYGQNAGKHAVTLGAVWRF